MSVIELEFPPDKFLFNYSEAARFLHISRHLVKLAIDDGDLHAVRIGSLPYVTRQSIEKFQRKLQGTPGDG
jgi:Helix-turn-helix domain